MESFLPQTCRVNALPACMCVPACLRLNPHQRRPCGLRPLSPPEQKPFPSMRKISLTVIQAEQSVGKLFQRSGRKGTTQTEVPVLARQSELVTAPNRSWLWGL
jgi:hypothetical protein